MISCYYTQEKKHISYPLPETACLSSCLFKTPSALIGQLAHDWASAAHRVSGRLCRVFQLTASFTSIIKMALSDANVWHGDVAWCQEVTGWKAGRRMRRFRGSVFCRGEELLLEGTFLTKSFFYAQKPIEDIYV